MLSVANNFLSNHLELRINSFWVSGSKILWFMFTPYIFLVIIFFSLPPSTKNVLDSLENDELIYISVNGLLCVVCVSFPSILKSECVCGVCCVRVHSMRGWLTFSLICSHRWMNEMNGMLLFGRIIFFLVPMRIEYLIIVYAVYMRRPAPTPSFFTLFPPRSIYLS